MNCPRCQGFVYQDADDTRCLLCGWYDNLPVCPPITVNPERSWESVLCLCGKSAQRGKEQCLSCKGRLHGKDHADKIRAGMQLAKDRR